MGRGEGGGGGRVSFSQLPAPSERCTLRALLSFSALPPPPSATPLPSPPLPLAPPPPQLGRYLPTHGQALIEQALVEEARRSRLLRGSAPSPRAPALRVRVPVHHALRRPAVPGLPARARERGGERAAQPSAAAAIARQAASRRRKARSRLRRLPASASPAPRVRRGQRRRFLAPSFLPPPRPVFAPPPFSPSPAPASPARGSPRPLPCPLRAQLLAAVAARLPVLHLRARAARQGLPHPARARVRGEVRGGR